MFSTGCERQVVVRVAGQTCAVPLWIAQANLTWRLPRVLVWSMLNWWAPLRTLARDVVYQQMSQCTCHHVKDTMLDLGEGSGQATNSDGKRSGKGDRGQGNSSTALMVSTSLIDGSSSGEPVFGTEKVSSHRERSRSPH
jgi:hypothetical protein